MDTKGWFPENGRAYKEILHDYQELMKSCHCYSHSFAKDCSTAFASVSVPRQQVVHAREQADCGGGTFVSG